MSRDYGKVAPKFWTGETGDEIRRMGPEAVIVSLYLMTSPHSNMLGLYHQPLLYMAEETGLGIEGARKGLEGCIEAGFCHFHEASKMVWVIEMARFQIDEGLKASDKRCAGVQKEYDALPNNPYLPLFYERYHAAFHMRKRRDFEPPKPRGLVSPFGGATKPGTGTGTGTGTPPYPPTGSEGPSPAEPNQASPEGLACKAMKAKGLGIVNPGDPRLIALCRNGATAEEFSGIAEEAVRKGVRNPFGWCLAVLQNRREEAARITLAPNAAQPWHATRSGVVARAIELGLEEYREMTNDGHHNPWMPYERRVVEADRAASECAA